MFRKMAVRVRHLLRYSQVCDVSFPSANGTDYSAMENNLRTTDFKLSKWKFILQLGLTFRYAKVRKTFWLERTLTNLTRVGSSGPSAVILWRGPIKIHGTYRKYVESMRIGECKHAVHIQKLTSWTGVWQTGVYYWTTGSVDGSVNYMKQ